MRGQRVEADCLGGEAIQAQNSCTISPKTCQTRKRKIDNVIDNDDGKLDSNDENVSPNTTSSIVVKRICREKTGTDWQTVLNLLEYDAEKRGRQTR
jgi:hypothetical protein